MLKVYGILHTRHWLEGGVGCDREDIAAYDTRSPSNQTIIANRQAQAPSITGVAPPHDQRAIAMAGTVLDTSTMRMMS